jgi:hypothetical protein
MTKDDIILMAREAGFERVVAIHPDGSKTVTVAPVLELEAFAALVAEHEREACAKVAEQFEPDEKTSYVMYASKAIRARGNT